MARLFKTSEHTSLALLKHVLAARAHPLLVLLCVLLAGVMLWGNFTMQTTKLGSHSGQYADQFDSFSEYIVRNSTLDRISRGDPFRANMIKSAGYPKVFSYTAKGNSDYYSNRGLQVSVYALLGQTLGPAVVDAPERFFQGLRLLNCLALAAVVTLFFCSWLGQTRFALFCALGSLQITGFALGAANLYFQLWIMALPMLCLGLLTRGRHLVYVLAAFLVSLLYFAVRYEFATTFALLWLLPVVLESTRRGIPALRLGAAAFIACCAAFVVALVLHHLAVARELGIPLAEASGYVLSNMNKRLASLDGVPLPLTPGFFALMGARWSHTGWALPMLVEIKKLSFLLLFVWSFWALRGTKAWRVLIWAGLAYASWYVFAYQHIMWHYLYDSLLFALTLQMALVVIWSDRLRLSWLVCQSDDKR